MAFSGRVSEAKGGDIRHLFLLLKLLSSSLLSPILLFSEHGCSSSGGGGVRLFPQLSLPGSKYFKKLRSAENRSPAASSSSTPLTRPSGVLLKRGKVTWIRDGPTASEQLRSGTRYIISLCRLSIWPPVFLTRCGGYFLWGGLTQYKRSADVSGVI